MTFSGNVTGTVPQAQRLEGVNDIAERFAVTYGLCMQMTTDRNVIEWVYETAQEGTPGATAEGAQKNQIDNNFVVASVSLKKYTAYLKVSTEMLDDASFMEGWLRNKLILRLFLAVDNGILNADGTSNTVDGILNNATAFDAGTFANTVYNANDVDSLTVAINQIKIANQAVGNLAIMMHPSDVTALKLEKVSTTDKRYVEKLSMVGDQLSLSGVPIVENVNITAGDFLVGDFSKATVVQKSGINVEVGLDGNDLTKNMRTFVAEWRGALFIENNNTTAFVTGTFATTNAALLLT
jgi:HK97 family phage major capsid protein